MHNHLRLWIALTVLALLVGSAQVRAQRVGGYREVSIEDSLVVQAVGAALLQKETGGTTVMLVAVERAEQQVVAGMNYRLCLRVRVTDTAEEIETVQLVRAVVYRNLAGEYRLSSWKEEVCGADPEGE